ncbi:RNA polymerase subunit AC19 [Elasticomyces elasticus]|nr:RNA polymerase subunit AC19 [Elasticomyces elasticus]
MSSASQEQTAPDAPPDSWAEQQARDGTFYFNKQRLKVLHGSSDEAASFQFENEDHTLGNALRYVIMKDPRVEFCGYSIPHPSEAKMNLRIQSWDGASVYDILEDGLKNLMDLCDVVTEKFTAARDEFNEKNGAMDTN